MSGRRAASAGTAREASAVTAAPRRAGLPRCPSRRQGLPALPDAVADRRAERLDRRVCDRVADTLPIATARHDSCLSKPAEVLRRIRKGRAGGIGNFLDGALVEIVER